ncbi:type III secretion system translocon subunit SctE [Stenotrophomonas sp.]|uniref:type III secretion system translocon subunit SctE n=1 Tax=Stenotrophomonas sp. TaxID=69392 RepID=UPI0028AB0024|nr:type III secretion system translocon subunit SctE [Stenotrophomonas sp.]
MTTITSSFPTPLAFANSTSPGSSPRASLAAAGFGAVSLEQVKTIDAKVVDLLAKAASESGQANAAATPAAGTPELRKAETARLMRAAQQSAGTVPGQAALTPESVLTMLAMQLSEVVSQENSRSLSAQLELIKARLAQRAASGAELSEAIRVAQALVDAAMGEVSAGQTELAAALQALKQAEGEVARLEQALAEAPPEEQEAIRAQLEAAKATVAQQQARVGTATAALAEATAVLDKALGDLEAFKGEADKLDPTNSLRPGGDEGARTNAAKLSELLAMLQEIIGKMNDAKLENDTKLTQDVLKAREAENMRRSQEYQDEVAKAEQAQKKMGCIGKIIGWVVTVVAVVAAPFTGGASMALAGIGLALAIGEELGLDVMGKIMEPVMKLIMELVKAVGNVIGDVLTSLGVSSTFADKIKDVLGVIAVAAMIIAAAVLSKKFAGSMAVQQVTKAVTRAVTEAISKALPQILKSVARSAGQAVDDVAKALSKAVANISGSTADNAALRAGQATKAMHVMQFANQTSQGVGAIIIADMYINAAELKEKVELGLVDSQILRDLIQKILQYFMQTNTLVADLFRQMTDFQASQDEAAKFVTARVGTVAA